MRATGVGSLPGDDIDRAVSLVFDELPDLPHLPELPGRGPGADMIGRSAAMLADLHVDLQPSGWRLVPRPGLDERRARELLERDLDALVPVAASYAGTVKVQVAGPWTLAASVQTVRGPALADAGAVRDLAESLAEGLRDHVEQVRRRVPHATFVVQLDEPSLPGVLAGQVPTASGFGRIRAVEPVDAEAVLSRVVAAAAGPATVHCCAAAVPVALLRRAGAAAVSLDLLGSAPSWTAPDWDALGEAVEAGTQLWLGVVPARGPGVPPTARDVAEPVRELWRRLGFAAESLPASVVLTPACGLAGASPGWARTAYRLVRQAARVLDEAPEGVSG